MADSSIRESRSMSTSPSGHLTAPPFVRLRSASNASSCHSDVTTVENNDDCDLEQRKLLRQQTFVIDTNLSFFDLLKGMIWPTGLKRKIEESVKPAYSKKLDEDMFDHHRSPYDLDVHVAPKNKSTRYKTTRCWFDTGCFQGNIVSKDIIEELGFDESDHIPLSTRERQGGKTMNGTIHNVDAAILLTWHHNTSPKFKDMRFLISSTLDSTMIIGVRSIVRHSIMSPPVFMSTDEPKKRYHRPLKEDEEIIKLSDERADLVRLVANLDRNIERTSSANRRREYEEMKTQAIHKKDMVSLKFDLRKAKVNTALEGPKKKLLIEQLEKQIAQGELAESKRLSRSRQATPQPP
ncbi:hypothetical protein SVAN01_08141 [Stagonosporopsis vannaccii]|nr:hypothetical protein SVAN01_08141 [Stagonosporopsis vannaccii]